MHAETRDWHGYGLHKWNASAAAERRNNKITADYKVAKGKNEKAEAGVE